MTIGTSPALPGGPAAAREQLLSVKKADYQDQAKSAQYHQSLQGRCFITFYFEIIQGKT